jgi:hypothetical protein
VTNASELAARFNEHPWLVEEAKKDPHIIGADPVTARVGRMDLSNRRHCAWTCSTDVDRCVYRYRLEWGDSSRRSSSNRLGGSWRARRPPSSVAIAKSQIAISNLLCCLLCEGMASVTVAGSQDAVRLSSLPGRGQLRVIRDRIELSA